MELAELISLVFQMGGGIAFPIVMCILLFQYIKTEQEQTREILSELKQTIETLSNKIEWNKKND